MKKGLPVRFNLMINGYVGEGRREELNTVEGINLFLRKVCEWADMKLITTQTINLDDAINDGDWYGLSGLAMIATSHVAFHIWPTYDSYYMFDISSCKSFSPDDLIAKIEEYFEHKCEWNSYQDFTPLKYLESKQE